MFQSAILLAGVLGNVMVVVTVRGTKSLHTTTNCYLVSLALADLITLLSSVPQVARHLVDCRDSLLSLTATCALTVQGGIVKFPSLVLRSSRDPGKIDIDKDVL